MAFQDFDLIQERRNQVRQQRLKKRITIAVLSISIILLLVAAAFCAMLYKNRLDEKDTVNEKDSTPTSTAKKTSPEKHHPSPSKPAAATENKTSPTSPPSKATPAPGPAPGPAPALAPALAPGPASGPLADTAVKALCATTDYPESCETALKANASGSEPKQLVTATISAANESVDKAITAVTDIKSDDPFKKAALNNCLTLLNDAKDELNTTVSSMDGKDMEKLKPELNNYLSAVMSYQQTCIDGLPDGDEKNKVQIALDSVKQQTSNSLAMVTQNSSVPGGPNINRRLLSKKSLLHPSSDDSFPTWADQELRRNLKADLPTQTPNATVAKNGSGNFTSITDALAAIPETYEGRYFIYVKEGIYEENVVVTKKMVNLTIYGEGSQKSVVTGSKNIIDGIPTYQTATFVAEGEGFMAQSLGFRNTAGAEKHEAVALRVKSDRSIFLNCRMEGYQSTIFAQTHRQYYRSCYITGTIDIIFGDAAAVFQNCDFYLRMPLENQQNVVISQYRVDKRETTGIVLQNCHILADDKLEPEKKKFKSYLGKSFKNYSRAIVMESEISDVIDPEGWIISQGDIGINTGFYAEFSNKGPGAEITGRVKWEGYKSSISKEEAVNFTVGPFLQGESWLKGGNVPVRFGLFN